MLKIKSFISKFLFVVFILGSLWLPVDNNHFEKVSASGGWMTIQAVGSADFNLRSQSFSHEINNQLYEYRVVYSGQSTSHITDNEHFLTNYSTSETVDVYYFRASGPFNGTPETYNRIVPILNLPDGVNHFMVSARANGYMDSRAYIDFQYKLKNRIPILTLTSPSNNQTLCVMELVLNSKLSIFIW